MQLFSMTELYFVHHRIINSNQNWQSHKSIMGYYCADFFEELQYRFIGSRSRNRVMLKTKTVCTAIETVKILSNC